MFITKCHWTSAASVTVTFDDVASCHAYLSDVDDFTCQEKSLLTLQLSSECHQTYSKLGQHILYRFGCCGEYISSNWSTTLGAVGSTFTITTCSVMRTFIGTNFRCCSWLPHCWSLTLSAPRNCMSSLLYSASVVFAEFSCIASVTLDTNVVMLVTEMTHKQTTLYICWVRTDVKTCYRAFRTNKQ